MIAIREMQVTIDVAQEIATEYISTIFEPTYFTSNGKKIDDGWYFMVKCHREDMTRTPAVGGVFVCASGQVENLSADRIRDMKEVGEVQAAQARCELARDENCLVLRRHARIKANAWTTHHLDHKVAAKGGLFIPTQPPIWRFSIQDVLVGSTSDPLDVIDVDANTGEVFPLTKRQMEFIVGGLCAARGIKEQTTAA